MSRAAVVRSVVATFVLAGLPAAAAAAPPPGTDPPPDSTAPPPPPPTTNAPQPAPRPVAPSGGVKPPFASLGGTHFAVPRPGVVRLRFNCNGPFSATVKLAGAQQTRR